MAKYWFKRRRYGYGWVPVSWQGWTVITGFLVVVIAASVAFTDETQDKINEEHGFFLLILILSVSALFKISYAKGPTPKWRWGKTPQDDPEKDW